MLSTINAKGIYNERKRLNTAFRRWISLKNPGSDIREYIGTDFWTTKLWIERLWMPQMTWDNYGDIWVIDHIVPLRMFDVFDKNDLSICWHYKNLMPLLKDDNLKKEGNCFFAFELLNELKHTDTFLMALYERVKPEVIWMIKYIEQYHNKYNITDN